MICESRLHWGRDAQRLMHPAKVEVRVVDRNHVRVVSAFFAERELV
jgi:hypothetical protein